MNLVYEGLYQSSSLYHKLYSDVTNHILYEAKVYMFDLVDNYNKAEQFTFKGNNSSYYFFMLYYKVVQPVSSNQF